MAIIPQPVGIVLKKPELEDIDLGCGVGPYCLSQLHVAARPVLNKRTLETLDLRLTSLLVVGGLSRLGLLHRHLLCTLLTRLGHVPLSNVVGAG